MKLLKEYIQEYFYFKRPSHNKSPGFSKFFRGLFSSENGAVDSWLDSQSEKHQISFDDEFREKVKRYAADNYDTVSELASESGVAVEKVISRLLDRKYGNYIKRRASEE